MSASSANDASLAAVKKITVDQVGRLPASAQSLLQSPRPSDHILVLSDPLFQPLEVDHGTLVSVADRIATVYCASDFLGQSSSNLHPSITLLSPCLFAAINHAEPVTVSTIVPEPTEFKSVHLAVAYHTFQIPPDRATRAANLARAALLNRDAYPGDVVPVSPMLWLYVFATDPPPRQQFDKGRPIVTRNTRIAVRISMPSSASSSKMFCSNIPMHVLPQLRQWALHQSTVFNLSADESEALQKINHALDIHAPLTIIHHTNPILLNTLVRYASVGRPAVHTVRSNSAGITAAAARAGLILDSMNVSRQFKHDSVFGTYVIVSRNAHADDVANTILQVIDYYTSEASPSVDGYNSRGLVSMLLCARDLDSVHIKLRQAASIIIPLKVPPPTESQRSTTLTEIGAPESLASQCAGLTLAETTKIGEVFQACGLAASERVARLATGPLPTVNAGGVTWGDVGGLSDVKRHVSSLIRRTRRRTRATTKGTEPQSILNATNSNGGGGVLLYGPPGTGKTLIARAVAGECGCAFLAVKGAELLDMYVGESERKVRMVFERAKDASPTVMFFDEIDALAPTRTCQGSDAGTAAVDRVVAQLLAELDQAREFNVIVIGATNRPDLVDPAVTRPGRLDKLVYVGMPPSRDAQVTVLKAQTRKFVLGDSVDFMSALEHAPPPPRLSGADLYALAATAWTSAAKRLISNKRKEENMDGMRNCNEPLDVDESEVDGLFSYVDGLNGLEKKYEAFLSSSDPDDTQLDVLQIQQVGKQTVSFVQVEQKDFVDAAKTLKPSLTLSQLTEYEALRQQIEKGD